MCTVTFIPTRESIFMVSNRDEKHHRKDAAAPRTYRFKTGDITFPKDGDAGGTWIAVHENGNAIVLLNGAFEAHISSPPYRLSRGLLLLELLDSLSPSHHFRELELNGIEPFTAVIWDDLKLFECVWDGTEKHISALRHDQPHIWSSSTLYENEVRSRRRSWFEKWLGENNRPELEDILHFHEFTGDGDPHNDLLMNRNGHIYTVSITGLSLRAGTGKMTHVDLRTGNRHELDLHFTKQPAGSC